MTYRPETLNVAAGDGGQWHAHLDTIVPRNVKMQFVGSHSCGTVPLLHHTILL